MTSWNFLHRMITSTYLVIFNIHFEKSDDPSTRKFKDLLDELSLQQPIAVPTHKDGHTLDLLLMRDSLFESPAPSVLDMALSDHFVIQLNLPYHRTKPETKVINTKNIKSIDIDVFKSELVHKLSESSFLDFTCCIKETLDKFAPLKKRIVSSRPFAPWINIFVKAQKQVKRQAERLYRKTGLTIHKDIFKFQKNKTVNVIKEEKRKYILQKKIASSNSSKELFKTFSDLIGKKKNNSLPVDVPKNELPNSFNVFFTDKIEKIRNKLDQNPTQTFFKTYRGPTLSSFASVTEEYARKIISKCKKKF